MTGIFECDECKSEHASMIWIDGKLKCLCKECKIKCLKSCARIAGKNTKPKRK